MNSYGVGGNTTINLKGDDRNSNGNKKLRSTATATAIAAIANAPTHCGYHDRHQDCHSAVTMTATTTVRVVKWQG